MNGNSVVMKLALVVGFFFCCFGFYESRAMFYESRAMKEKGKDVCELCPSNAAQPAVGKVIGCLGKGVVCFCEAHKPYFRQLTGSLGRGCIDHTCGYNGTVCGRNKVEHIRYAIENDIPAGTYCADPDTFFPGADLSGFEKIKKKPTEEKQEKNDESDSEEDDDASKSPPTTNENDTKTKRLVVDDGTGVDNSKQNVDDNNNHTLVGTRSSQKSTNLSGGSSSSFTTWTAGNVAGHVARATAKSIILHQGLNRVNNKWLDVRKCFGGVEWDIINRRMLVELLEGILYGSVCSGTIKGGLKEAIVVYGQEQLVQVAEKVLAKVGVPKKVQNLLGNRYWYFAEGAHAVARIALRSIVAAYAHNKTNPDKKHKKLFMLPASLPYYCQKDANGASRHDVSELFHYLLPRMM